jgi:MoxR-like ATPase
MSDIKNIDSFKRKYMGDGQRHYKSLPGALTEDEPYMAAQPLVAAVNLALNLRRPLLLEGDPGCGKTRLAYAIAHELGYRLYECYIRSTSKARDLLYSYDGIERLYDVQANQLFPRDKYVTLGPLGDAIKLSQDEDQPSIVLIDEIDKADIDFPNDLLLVLDQLRFEVDEIKGLKYNALKGQRRDERKDVLPFFIITSNREKELPKPFLRRCLFHYIEFPDQDALLKIIESHSQRELTPLFVQAVIIFWEIRSLRGMRWRKIPSTSELLEWIRALEQSEHEITAQQLASTPLKDLPYLEALVKTRSDQIALMRLGTAQHE